MTDTIQTTADTAAEATDAVQAEEFLYLDPAEIIIGTNVRTDLRADHKEFRKSIKERGVLEAVTVYRNEDGQYVLLRGQRRTVTAAEVGTPTGLIPARVVPQPADADRIGDQIPFIHGDHQSAAFLDNVIRYRQVLPFRHDGAVEHQYSDIGVLHGAQSIRDRHQLKLFGNPGTAAHPCRVHQLYRAVPP